ncbi:hypothetical protein F0562_002982 [Nyssa sinensis]|uniref:Uncharacterized protein n=1 Tax=Nyssa sinensis TaxID=561372 RepID=A0A5J5BTM6_9ASTE|nr:hypothetical protein F0562_002982 [Nyssa sinensis]
MDKCPCMPSREIAINSLLPPTFPVEAQLGAQNPGEGGSIRQVACLPSQREVREAVAQLGDCSNGSEADRSDSRDLDGGKSVMEAVCEVMGFWQHGRWCGDTTVEGQGSELGDEGSKGDEHSAELDMVVEETQLQGKGIEMGQREKSGLWCRPILHRGNGFSSFTEIP